MWNDLLYQLKQLPPFVSNLLLTALALLTGLLFKGLVTLLLKAYAKANINFSLFKSVLYRLNQPISFFLPLVTLSMVLPMMTLSAFGYRVVDKLLTISLIITFAMVLIAIVKISEDFFTIT